MGMPGESISAVSMPEHPGKMGGSIMPHVHIKDLKQYERALEVLTRVGGTFQGVGTDEWFLLVTESQYKALVDAKVVPADNNATGKARGAKSKRKAQL
jgi:hypothetical protein